MKLLKAIPVMLVLAAGWTCANAAADFITVQRGQSNLDDSVPRFLRSFTLPTAVNRSSTIANSAVLDLEVGGSEYNFNEIYINPPTTVCTSNGTDANQAASIGALQEHDDTNLRVEWAANHIAFSSSLLKAGTNTVMICVRSETGEAGQGVGNLDNVSLRSMVLHYHTN
jgi:hypothetical protein